MRISYKWPIFGHVPFFPPTLFHFKKLLMCTFFAAVTGVFKWTIRGRNQEIFVFVALHCYFSHKSHIHGLKWKLWSSLVCRINYCYPMLFNFFVGQLWSQQYLTSKFDSFCYINFWISKIYDLHVSKWKQIFNYNTQKKICCNMIAEK